MSHEVLQQIDYHASRAIEELERANGTSIDVERRSHMELGRLHLYRAGWLRAAQDGKLDETRQIEQLLYSASAGSRAAARLAVREPLGAETG